MIKVLVENRGSYVKIHGKVLQANVFVPFSSGYLELVPGGGRLQRQAYRYWEPCLRNTHTPIRLRILDAEKKEIRVAVLAQEGCWIVGTRKEFHLGRQLSELDAVAVQSGFDPGLEELRLHKWPFARFQAVDAVELGNNYCENARREPVTKAGAKHVFESERCVTVYLSDGREETVSEEDWLDDVVLKEATYLVWIHPRGVFIEYTPNCELARLAQDLETMSRWFMLAGRA